MRPPVHGGIVCAAPQNAVEEAAAAMTDVPGSIAQPLAGRHILLGVCGGIAAYKTPELVRRLRERGADVQVVMTENAHRFVTPVTLQAVSGRPVRADLWDEAAEAAMGHIELARWADLLLIAPATADILSRLAAGRADDLLTTLRLATRAPLVVAPAMNHVMWEHPATRRNLAALVQDGCTVLGPDSGAQACGEFGPGRMVEPEAIAAALTERLGAPAAPRLPGALDGRRVLVTAGPTREAIDPVRYISNHSSGKQGYAVAAAAAAAGAQVTLVSGPVNLAPPEGVEVVRVTSAMEMDDAVQARLAGCEVFIGVAAVADYRPGVAAGEKIKKTPANRGGMTLALVENPDIIAGVAASAARPFVVGFAAETHEALPHAREKRVRKGMDMIVVNDVSRPDIGFNTDENDVTVIWDGGEERLPKGPKSAIAAAIVERIEREFSRQTVDRLALANRQPVAE
jgi:phosphopantothenoylcysteine decarboxylase/phosphopantothenate--cysteine ligase